MTPIDYYHEQQKKGFIIKDEHQWAALQSLQQVYFDLSKEHKKRSGFLSFFRQPQLVPGIYLWGGVGIGKTFLMDCLYQCLPFSNKMRMHFHQFMQLLHESLKNHQGKANPLQWIANDFAKKYMVLCFDELIVSDITDAMLLGRLFAALFNQGVSLIATSNSRPDDLYKDGLQRRQFLPAIALLKQHTKVVHLPAVVDYRLHHLKEVGVFHIPNDEIAQRKMEKTFALLTQGNALDDAVLEIHGRSIQTKKLSGEVVWFDFNVICNIPRSQLDYLAIAKKFHTVFITGIPVMQADESNKIALFIRLVDVLYDAKIRLICSAESQIKHLYSEGRFIFDYTRTHSRLLEMQSERYFNHPGL